MHNFFLESYRKCYFLLFFIKTLIAHNSLTIHLTSLRGNSDTASVIGESLYQVLAKNFTVNHIPSRTSQTKKTSPKKNAISIYADVLWYTNNELYKNFNSSFINFAYVMFEGNKIPQKMVEILNHKFDAVIVPNSFLKQIYIENGVKKPIFIVPLPMIGLEKFPPLCNNLKKNKTFTFGYLGGLHRRKGVHILLDSFSKQFGNNSKFKLKIHCNWWDSKDLLKETLLFTQKYNNIEFSYGSLPFDTSCKFYSQIDAYIAISAGEGYSLTPREAMYSQVPVIVSDYGVQKELAESNLVYPIKATEMEDAFISCYGGNCGTYLFPSSKNLMFAMQDLYENYAFYKKQILPARQWINDHYSIESIALTFKRLFSPHNVDLEFNDFIYHDGLITTSKKLKDKILDLQARLGEEL